MALFAKGFANGEGVLVRGRSNGGDRLTKDQARSMRDEICRGLADGEIAIAGRRRKYGSRDIAKVMGITPTTALRGIKEARVVRDLVTTMGEG